MSMLATATLAAAEGGILDLANDKLADLKSTLTLGGSVFVIGLLILYTFKGGFTVGKLLMNGLLAGIFIFLITNADFLADKTEAEFNSAPPAVVQTTTTSHEQL